MPVKIQTGPSDTERRRFPRYQTAVKLHYQHLKHIKANKAAHLQESVTKDLSAGGLAMLSEQKMESGQTLMLTLFLPEKRTRNAKRGEAEPVQAYMLCRVIWQTRISRNLYLNGIQFIDLTTEDRKRLGSFLKTCKIPTNS